MTTQTIDAICQQINSTKGLILAGGEPFLNTKAIQHIASKVTNDELDTIYLSAITNGTVYSDELFAALNSIADYLFKKHKEKSIVVISDDVYHQTDKVTAIKLFRDNLSNNIEVKLWSETFDHDFQLIDLGRAKQIDACKSAPYCSCHKIELDENDYIKCPLYIDVNGNVTLAYEKSFADEDNPENIIANVNTDNLALKLLQEWTWKYPVTCRERCIQREANIRMTSDGESAERVISLINNKEKARKQIHNYASNVGIDDVIKMTDTYTEYLAEEDPEKKLELEKQVELNNQVLEWAKQENEFAGHEEAHKQYPHLTLKECISMDNSLKFLQESAWHNSGYGSDFIEKVIAKHSGIVADLQGKNEKRAIPNNILQKIGNILFLA